MTEYHQGTFKPTHPEKYVGDVSNIIYRSSWEKRFMIWADTTPSVLKWASEEITIPYIHPLDKQPHRYFPDFCIQYKDRQGRVLNCIIEIKPSYQTKEPVIKKGMHRRRLLREVSTWAINQAKWKAADTYAKKRNMEFKILTEQELGL